MKTKITVRRRKAQSVEPLKNATIAGMKRLFKAAIAEFLKEAVETVEVDTGMTASTFLSAAGQVQQRQIIASLITGFGPKRPGHKSLYGANVPSENIATFKSRSLGDRLGKKAYTIKFATKADPYMFFEFRIVSLQHFFNEAKWGSLDAAQAALTNYILENWEDYIPDVANWLINGRIASRK